MTLVFAHPGHWAIQLIYLAPLAFLIFAVARAKIRERRGVGAGQADHGHDGDQPDGHDEQRW